MRIALGVSSSISVYKAAEILREFQKLGHTVKVAMTRNSTRFVTPFLFQSLSQHPVYLDEFEASRGEVQHIELARETDLIVVAPASANVIGKFANGIADDFLSTFFLARRCPVLIAPAMNTYMYQNPVVQENIQKLKSLGIEFVNPDEGYLACGDEGPGRLAPVEEIVSRSVLLLNVRGSLSGKKVLVTAGPTWEPLDPVRVVTNRSSGKMGFAMAAEAAARGAQVTLITGPTQISAPLNVDIIRVETAEQMKTAVQNQFDSADYLVKAAAVSDFKPAEFNARKKKKTGTAETLELHPTIDILSFLLERKRNQIMIGFCAETENLEQNAREKLKKKKLDFIIANQIGSENNPFQSDLNEVTLFDSGGSEIQLEKQSKKDLASKLWDMILERTKHK